MKTQYFLPACVLLWFFVVDLANGQSCATASQFYCPVNQDVNPADGSSCVCMDYCAINCRKVTEVPAFKNDSSFRNLFFYESSLGKIPPHAFENLRAVGEISLKSSGVTELLSDSFAGVSMTVFSIPLMDNFIEYLPANVFQGLRFSLYLWDNQISDLHKDAFKGYLGGHVELGSNRLQSFVDIDIQGVRSLQLYKNELSVFDVDISNLEWLILNNNNLTSFSGERLKSANKMEKLDLSSNKLQDFPVNALAGLNITDLNLSDNPLPCSMKGDIEKVYKGKLAFPRRISCTGTGTALKTNVIYVFALFITGILAPRHF